MILWVPSHIGFDFVDLQPQNHTWVVAVAVYSRGARPKALWEPSQKGCLALRPQAHHQYFLPASTLTGYGDFCAGMGSAMLYFLPLGPWSNVPPAGATVAGEFS